MGRIYKRTNSSFYQISFTGPDGNLYRETTKTKSKREAEQYLKRRIFEISSGAIKGLHFTTRMDDLIKLWQEDQIMKKRKSYSNNLYRIKYIQEFFDPIRIVDITPKVITRYILQRQNQNASTDTINLELSILRRLLYLGKYNDLISKIPKIEMIPGNHIRQGTITKTEYETMIKHASPLLRPVIVFLYHTGFRKNECLNLRWENVNMEKRIITLSPDETKEQFPRVVPFSNVVYELFTEIRKDTKPDPSTLIFCNSQGQKINSFYHLWKKMEKKCNFSHKIICHDLRRTFVSNSIRAGINETIIRQMVGHKTNSMFIRYGITNMDDKENAVIKISEFLSQK